MRAGEALPTSRDKQLLAAKISRAMLSGPFPITRDATVADMDAQGNVVVLRQGTNQWVCFPGDENEIGNVPMCADPMGLQWMRDIMAGKPAPTNTAPGIIYMLCGATQHSNTDPFDRSSPAIPIGQPADPFHAGSALSGHSRNALRCSPRFCAVIAATSRPTRRPPAEGLRRRPRRRIAQRR